MGRLIVVSNRVATPTETKGSAGGLAVGVFGALKDTGGVWFGWSGDVVSETVANAGPTLEQDGPVTFATVGLTRKDYDQYYRGFSNATLWPVFHYRNDLARYERDEYAGYRRVNAWLAHKLMKLIDPDDIVWVHDYHLIPFAEALRSEGVTNRIGFFLHIPFPSPQVLQTIPPHEELVKSLCCYDLLGFQTRNDQQAFHDYIVRSARGAVGEEGEHGDVEAFGRRLRTGVYRIGVFPDEIAEQAKRYESRQHVLDLKQSLEGRKLIMSVDRLDYSKGLVERFKAFEQLLERSPEWRGNVTLVQIAPPTRSDVATYRNIREELEGEAGRINGRYSGLDYTPIRYLSQQYDRWKLMSLFRESQVGFVTPLHDGMNLVAKEYVAAQNPSDPGVLVLSVFAGAAAELSGALLVNPHDALGMCEALQRALSMPLAERQARYETNMEALRRNDLGVWRDSFLHDLRSVPHPGQMSQPQR
ncbi:alpha,alpha-trehalose-phosphate synthase (UDP-forming) [Paraburkholderia caballeronis]|uniref:Trehalose-6-phosphate synthase n=1 Tax=Paraburkholderia caballeronis TaxID=416943 RepID=A0A1H7JE68_9BURK|nr:alpha,alpha-trehalose-phosphate synthase (UDP-forming) [Paraburkholderia caballeronis]PXW27459.1 trehalose 6-phosphate synthase [Paraburkholderia caballeronis]PXX02933.1 trehalose 6-phosphate synthase [Paraburkholderia caballeronis]RAK03658.1 trehalose 6-phosphate synthase [Paraburkholderia caballeronis]TDV06086.1 trehalose 6-phosphate synthase [Paraburkholderia caballeronis]TDV09626.1 trehalose 6-phosphate synthase [Paraburkholderia caballeronis]